MTLTSWSPGHHERGIRIVLDMVFNHTSTQHAWFRESLNKKPARCRQFYIWRGVRGNSSSLALQVWRQRARRWHAERAVLSPHLFRPGAGGSQLGESGRRAELKRCVRVWADRGVDGLRLDVINLISKDQAFPNDDIGDGRRFYTDGPRIHEYLREMSRDVFTPRNLMTVGEMSSTSAGELPAVCVSRRARAVDDLNFHHLKVDYPAAKNGRWQNRISWR